MAESAGLVPIPEQVPAAEGFAPVAGGRLWYWDTGGSGEPLVLCHPASQSSQVWLYQQPVFAHAGYRVVAYSRRAAYKSERGREDDSGTQLGDLLGVLDFLRVGKAHVLGAAAGGITALGLGCTHPARVSSLILAGTIFAPDEAEWRTVYDRLAMASARGTVPTEFLELGPSYRAEHPDGVARFVELERAARAGGPVLRQPLGAKVDWPTMERLDVPVLLLTGEADLYSPPPLQRLIAQHLRHRELASLREVGHAPYWEAPAEFNRLVLDFLRRHSDRK